MRKVANRNPALGPWGEQVAADYLAANGYAVLERNVHTAHGELDLVAAREGVLVFVEVKTRSSHAFAYPEASVTLRKQAYLLSAAQEYLEWHPECGETWQFDVLAIEGRPGTQPVIEHFENVFS
jgi:putative endonuclease